MNIIEMINVIKTVAKESGLINEIRLIKSGENVEDAVLSGGYRKLLLTVNSADLYKNDNSIVIHAMILDKTDEDDDVYLHSVNDGIALLRVIIDTIGKLYNNRIVASQLQVSSGKDEDSLMVSIETDLSMEFNIID